MTTDRWYDDRPHHTMPIPQGNETQPVNYTKGSNQGYYVSPYAAQTRPVKVYRSNYAEATGKPSTRLIVALCLLALATVAACGVFGWLMLW